MKKVALYGPRVSVGRALVDGVGEVQVLFHGILEHDEAVLPARAITSHMVGAGNVFVSVLNNLRGSGYLTPKGNNFYIELRTNTDYKGVCGCGICKAKAEGKLLPDKNMEYARNKLYRKLNYTPPKK